MAEEIAWILTKVLGTPAEAEVISKIELHDHQPNNTFRLILCTEKNAWRRSITITTSNGREYSANAGENYGSSHEKVKYSVINIDLSGSDYIDCYYGKMKVGMVCLKHTHVEKAQYSSLNTYTLMFYWPNDDSDYFTKAENRVSPGQLGL